jgi:hypothetical protein
MLVISAAIKDVSPVSLLKAEASGGGETPGLFFSKFLTEFNNLLQVNCQTEKL